MPSLHYEKKHGFEDGKIICGVDEAGRGPLAGPVMAAAVILPTKFPRGLKKDIRDSKQMTAAQREAAFGPLTEHCRYCITEANVAEIARFNILWASMLAMRRAIMGLERGLQVNSAEDAECILKIDVALIDGNRIPHPLECMAVAIISGDDKSLSIAAASILAKVTRDRFMTKLAEAHPGYGWERNFGYGTPEHLTALKELGPTDWHRAGFAPVMMQMELDMAS